MPRARNVQATRKRRKRVLKEASGYFGNRSRLYRYAKNAVERAGVYAYRDRRKRKSEFRSLWIVRINAACRPHGISYSRFMHGLALAKVDLYRKALSELAIHDEVAFKAVVDRAIEAVKNANA